MLRRPLHTSSRTAGGADDIRVRTAAAVERETRDRPGPPELVDWETFAGFLGVGRTRFYDIRAAAGDDFPPEAQRGIWYGAAARRFAREYQARVRGDGSAPVGDVYRVADPDRAPGGRAHWSTADRHGLVSTCSGWTLDESTRTDPDDVDQTHRCAGTGCRERWAAHDQAAQHAGQDGPA